MYGEVFTVPVLALYVSLAAHSLPSLDFFNAAHNWNSKNLNFLFVWG